MHPRRYLGAPHQHAAFGVPLQAVGDDVEDEQQVGEAALRVPKVRQRLLRARGRRPVATPGAGSPRSLTWKYSHVVETACNIMAHILHMSIAP